MMVSTLVGDYYSAGKSWAEHIRECNLIQAPFVHTKVLLIHEDDWAFVIAKELQQVASSSKTMHVYGHSISSMDCKNILSKKLNRGIEFK